MSEPSLADEEEPRLQPDNDELSLSDEIRLEFVRQAMPGNLEQTVKKIGRSWNLQAIFQLQAAKQSAEAAESAIVPLMPAPSAEFSLPERPEGLTKTEQASMVVVGGGWWGAN